MPKVKFGFFVQQGNPYSERINCHEGPWFYSRAAQTGENLGFDSFWQSDHWMLPTNSATLDCWSVLACVAASTKTIKLGSLVTPIVCSPPLSLAKRVLTVQLISKGRVILGAGAGWLKEEFEAFGIPFATFRSRTKELKEAIRLIRIAWKSKDPFSFRGAFFSVRNARMGPKSRLPPIWLGGSSKRILDIAASVGDGWIPNETPFERFADGVQMLSDSLESKGRRAKDMQIAYATRVVAASTKSKALGILHKIGAKEDFDSAAGVTHLLVGSYEECASQLGAYIDAGARYVVLSPQPTNKTEELLETVRDEVIRKSF